MVKEMVKYIICDMVILSMLGYLFYRSIPVMIIMSLAGTPLILRMQKKQYSERYKYLLEEQFKDAILSLAASLRAGYSVENALAEVYKELVNLYGEKSPMAIEFRSMDKQLKLNARVEDLFEGLGKKSGIDDIQSFASVFRIAKRSGGDMVAIISKTAKTIGDKFDVQREINTMLAAKRMEQRIMLVMPAAVLIYISMTNKGFLDVLYEGLVGRLVMSVCLVVYILAFWVGEKIVDIDI